MSMNPGQQIKVCRLLCCGERGWILFPSATAEEKSERQRERKKRTCWVVLLTRTSNKSRIQIKIKCSTSVYELCVRLSSNSVGLPAAEFAVTSKRPPSHPTEVFSMDTLGCCRSWSQTQTVVGGTLNRFIANNKCVTGDGTKCQVFLFIYHTKGSSRNTTTPELKRPLVRMQKQA